MDFSGWSVVHIGALRDTFRDSWGQGMARESSGRSRNAEDLFTLRTRRFEPGFRWVQPERDDGRRWLLREPNTPDMRVRLVMHDGRREVRSALSRFRQVAEGYEASTEDRPVMIAVAALASRYGTLYGDVPKPGALAAGTLDDWKVELLRFLDLWELGQALRFPSRRRATAVLVERLTDPERFVFRPRTLDIDGELVIASERERWTWVDPVTGSVTEMPIFQRMERGNTRTRLWIAFTVLLNRRMAGGLSLALHPFETTSASVGLAPHGLLALAYTRLWLDVVTAREESTPATARTCAHCRKPLPATATARMTYCDATCRQAHRRRSLHP